MEAPRLALRSVALRPGDRDGLRDVSLTLDGAAFTALVGDNGCATLLRVAGLHEPPEVGEVLIDGSPTRELAEPARTALRSRRFGFLFAAPYLLPSMSIVENVAVPLFKISHSAVDEARARTEMVLAYAGIPAGERRGIAELSPFEQQCVALARGLVHQPGFLVVDQADAGMRPEESARFIDLLREVPGRFSTAVLAQLASPFAVATGDRVLMIRDGCGGDDSMIPAQDQEAGS